MASYNFLTSTGVIVADTSTTRAEVEAEYRAIFGDDFIVDPATPQGEWITGEVTSRQSFIRNTVQVSNQLNPNIAGGTFFDGIWALTNGARDLATRSTVQCLISGVAGTSVPLGSIATDTSGNNWLLAATTVIPVGGSVAASFTAENTGPVGASAGTITAVTSAVLGWETVNNAVAAVLGANTQSDVSARVDRRNELALAGRSTARAVTSNLSATTGVSSWAFRENVADTTQVIDGITLLPHSIWAAVSGGTDADIGSALLEAKSGGANWNGLVLAPTVEAASGQTFPVRFDRPSDISVRVRVTARSMSGSSPSNDIITAVLNYANGLSDVGVGFTTGNDVSPFEISAAINSELTAVFVANLELAYAVEVPVYVNTTLPIALNEIATINSGLIEVILV